MPTNIYRLGEAEPLRGRLECECYLCGRRFLAWRSRFLRTGAHWCSAQCYRDAVRIFWQELRRGEEIVGSPAGGVGGSAFKDSRSS
jgi:hypothetical protein